MPIAVKLFASLGSRFGRQISLELEPPIAVADVEARLRVDGIWSEGSRIAVNHSFATGEDTVCPGDEVAVIPPVSGG